MGEIKCLDSNYFCPKSTKRRPQGLLIKEERAVVVILPRQGGAVKRCLWDSPELWRRAEDHAEPWLLWMPSRLSQLAAFALMIDGCCYDDDGSATAQVVQSSDDVGGLTF